MEQPTTPRTPTASAWWSLMEDDSNGNDELQDVAQESKTESENDGTNEWGYSFCTLIPHTDKYKQLGDNNRYISPENQPVHDTNAKLKVNHVEHMPSNENQSLLQRLQMYYGNLQTSTFSKIIKIEETINDGIEKVDSPCKKMTVDTEDMFERVESPCKMMMGNNDETVFDDYDDSYIYGNESETDIDESTIIERNESPDIFNELQAYIPSLRERGNASVSSKYKDIIGSVGPSSDNESIEKRRQSLIEKPEKTAECRNVQMMEEKFQKQYVESMKTLKTENSTKVSDDSPQAPPLPPNVHNVTPIVPLSMLETPLTMDEIIRKISSLTGDGEIFHDYSNQNDLGTDESKMCVPPLLMKKLSSLRNIKKARSQASLHSFATSTRRKLHSNDSSDDALTRHETRPIDDLFTESGSKNHAYVAFFRRGLKATHSIRLYQHPIPAIFPIIDGEVVVHVEASTISATDLHVRRGEVWGEASHRALNLPIVPGVTFSGIVYQTTQSGLKSGLNVGDRVLGLVQVGANSRHLCISSEQLVKIPEELNDPCSTACIPEIYLTAFQSLHMGQKNGGRYRKNSLSGKEILVLGGATLIGRALIEIAVAAGCSAVYATGKEKHFQTIYDYGGAPLGRDPRLWRSLLSQKLDIIVGIDHSVGESEINEDHVGLLSRNGRLILLCNPDRDETTINVHNELIDFFKIHGRKLNLYNVFDAWENDIKQCKRDLTHLLKLLSEDSIRPNILESVGLNKVARAQDLLSQHNLNGFIVCEPWLRGKKKENFVPDHVYAESASKSTSQEFSKQNNEISDVKSSEAL